MSLIYTVPQSHCVIIERFGKFARVQSTGINFRIPILEKRKDVFEAEWGTTANKNGVFIELTEQQTDTTPKECYTKDNAKVKVNAVYYWRITDPRKALYEVDILPKSLLDLVIGSLRSIIGANELDAVLSQREQINDSVSSQIMDAGVKWGVQFTRVEIQELTTDDKTADAMRQQMEGERLKRATIATAEGQAAAEVKIAEADKAAAILRAEGQAKALELITQAETKYVESLTTAGAEATNLLLAQKYLDGFDIITKNTADKVFLPNSFQALLSLSVDKPGPTDNQKISTQKNSSKTSPPPVIE
ncbi:SPFH/Band 7/PHB domain protein [bacterium]|nr:SPFH/Band 7/PHB domain protein [bacterium]